MDASVLAAAMGCSRSVADRYVAAFNAAMFAAHCTTINRAAMWCAQLGHESAGLRYMEEIASGAAYEGRRDLGNTQRGDGVRYKGRGPIQVTGRHNYTLVSRWAHSRGLVPDPGYFVAHPAELASHRYGFLGPVWYWTVARPTINDLCDAGDIRAVTRLINGGYNGLADRVNRWHRARSFGAAILPTGPGPAPVRAPAPAPPPPPRRRPREDDMPPPIRTPEPAKGTEKWDWPTVREILAFRPGSGTVKLDHGGRGGWVHAIIWWVRDPGWTPNVPKHSPRHHPVGASRGHAGSERFVGYGWESAPPPGADMVEVVFSAPDSAHLQFWRTD